MQVVQCLYKISALTFLLTDFVKLTGIGAVSTAYHYHYINTLCNFTGFLLPDFRCITNRVHNMA